MMRIKICNDNDSRQSMSLENSVLDDRDIDYLNHLVVPMASDVSTEGIIRSLAHGRVSRYGDGVSEMKGWVLNVESKRQYIEQICNDLILWLKDRQTKEPDLSLDVSEFRKWLATSDAFVWRFIYLLNNTVWSNIERDIKNDDHTILENIFISPFKVSEAMDDVLSIMTSAKTIHDLIAVVELYLKRSNIFFEEIIKRSIKIKNSPFQIILIGAIDLRRTVKKIVYMAM